GQRRWIADPRVSTTGSEWQTDHPYPIADAPDALRPSADSGSKIAIWHPTGVPPTDDLLERVREATAVREPNAQIAVRRDKRYLRVTAVRGHGVLEQGPGGVVEGNVTPGALRRVAEGVHAPFTAYDRHVPSELVYGGEPAPEALVAEAGRQGIRLRSFVDYQGLLDLRQLARHQAEALAADREYPAELYVPQRFSRVDR